MTIRGYLLQDVPVPGQHISVSAGAQCLIGVPVTGDRSSITLSIAGNKFTTVVDNKAIIIDSSHIDLLDFHSVQEFGGRESGNDK